MYPIGHYGVALLATAPVVVLLGRTSGTVFSTFVLFAAVLPDVDKHVSFVEHHGVTHTFLFAALSAVVVGVVVAVAYRAYVASVGPPRSFSVATKRVFVWVTAGIFLGTASHVTADILVVLPGTQPVSPFWPVFTQKLQFEVLSLGVATRNLAFLFAGLGIHFLVHHYLT